MRIKSNFKDYYDGIQRTILDTNCLYLRETEYIEQYDVWRGVRDDKYDITMSHCTVGVAGKFYKFVQIGSPMTNYEYFYNINSLDKGVEKLLSKDRVDYYYNNKYRWGNPDRKFYKEYLETPYSVGVNSTKVEGKSGYDIFTHFKVPVFTFGIYGMNLEQYISNTNYKVVLNPSLKNIQFFKVMDPVTVFQEIYMFLSGVLAGNNPEIPKVSDDDLITAKGFDKWSFRKEPSSMKGK